jgi:hypothetical protein
MPVSSNASLVTRSAASCMISTAIMPPSDRPARANSRAGIWSSTQRAVFSQVSKTDRGALRQSGTTMSATSLSAATCGANSRGEHNMPGTSSNGVLAMVPPRRT